jgi:hypothetical protein
MFYTLSVLLYYYKYGRVLTNNPLVCDCHLRWLPSFVDRNSTTHPLSSTLGTCDVPAQNLTGVAVSTLVTEDFECGKLIKLSAACNKTLKFNIKIPECDPLCVNGTCNTIIGVCQCDDGFIGTACDTGKDSHSTEARVRGACTLDRSA